MAGELISTRLSVDYRNRPRVLDNLEFTVSPGEIVGIVGRSGCGKSTLALALMRLIPASGSIRFDGRELFDLKERELRRIRGKDIALVLQSPMSALNPALRIETQLREAWRAHASGPPDLSRIDPEFLPRYPRQLSVGQAQRVMIAMAVLHKPKLLIADEPTSALDPESRDNILALFRHLNRTLGLAILYISHDLESVDRLCHRVIRLGSPHPSFGAPTTSDLADCASTTR